MCCSGTLYLLPLSCAILFPFTFIISYGIAVALDHVEAGFPYISDTGTMSPESCVFGQLLNICAVLVAATIYVRCQQVSEYNRHSPRILQANTASLIIGLISALGVSIVANFQETSVLIVHFAGAILAFGLGNIYCWIQTCMSYKMVPHMNSRTICHIRLFLSLMSSIMFVLNLTFGVMASAKYSGPEGKVRWHWKPSDGGYTEHIISTASEWAMAVFFIGFFLTFVQEFKKISMPCPRVHLVVGRRQPLANQQDDPASLVS